MTLDRDSEISYILNTFVHWMDASEVMFFLGKQSLTLNELLT